MSNEQKDALIREIEINIGRLIEANHLSEQEKIDALRAALTLAVEDQENRRDKW